VATGDPYDRSVTRARLRPLSGGRVRPGLLAPVVVAIVLGILGMHGIDAHGVHRHGALADARAATPPVAVGTAHASVAPDHGDAHLPSRSGADAVIAAVGDPGDVGGTGGMVMLCVAMLAGAAAVLLAVLGRPPRAWAVVQRARGVWPAAPPALRIGTGPPHVWRFSVIRC
jgi:hypothetical protein